MTTENKNVTVDAVENKLTLEQALEEIQKQKNINKEVISTRDEAKAKLSKFENDNKATDEAKLLEQKKFEELFKNEQTKKVELETKLKNKSIVTALKSAFKDAVDFEVIEKLVDKSSLMLTDDYEVDTSQLDKIVNDLKGSKPFLFKQEIVVPKAPDVKRTSEVKSPQSEYIAALKNVKTQAEFDKLRKMHGKS